MPAVTEEQKRNIRATRRGKDIRSYINDQMTEKHIRQREIAESLGMSQQDFSWKIRNLKFSMIELIAVFDYIGADPAELSEILARK